ncbi:GGDEF domain-containing phosphodiesterase [Cyanobium sp. FACHB-13342]|uniref:GGDEF domain-containing phosphodiesterase n=1 Tax=Cyanobium sp. FACHB-13342 TaxID=2692793 RepID=UPI0016819D5E|nr:GGDEF domain-containing phosphodiesterase [Cyanobium sp. FACHB-13342]
MGLSDDQMEVVCDLSEALTGATAARVILASQPMPADGVLIVEDAAAEPRLSDLRMPDSDQRVRFYARYPLLAPAGHSVGALCLYAPRPLTLDPRQRAGMAWLVASLEAVLAGQPPAGAGSREPSGESRGALTLLISRDQLIGQIEALLAEDGHPPFALLRCELKDYGSISATLGGRLAEVLIDEAARRLINAVPKAAVLARFSDSQFLVLLPAFSDPEQLSAIAQRMLDLFSEPFRVAEHRVPLALAVGIALQTGDYKDSEEIVSDTNMALRIASRQIQSQFRFFDLETRRLAQESYALEAEVRMAIAQKEMVPFFQPIVDLITAEPLGFEVLARWRRSNGHIVSPSVFVPVARAIGLSAELDLQIIQRGLEDAATLARVVPWREMVLSVNLSANLLEDDLMRQQLLQLIDNHALPLGWQLQMEILEESLQDSTAGFEAFLKQLSDRRIRITIDDFGTGYSSLSRLLSLPINGFKIDMSFVQMLDHPQRPSNKLVATMGTLATDLDLSTTAEGVETEPQRAWLSEHGFRFSQGFLFAPPMSLRESMRYLEGLNLRSSAIQPPQPSPSPSPGWGARWRRLLTRLRSRLS